MAYQTNKLVNLGQLKAMLESTKAQVGELASATVGAIEDVISEVGIVDHNLDTAIGLLVNAFRQHVWDNDDDIPICEDGTVTLTNTSKIFPFTTSTKSVALSKMQPNVKYAVVAEITSSAGNAGEVVVSNKQVNGFKLAFTGSATSATIHYTVIGGVNI